MKRIICIGECSLNIVVSPEGKPLGSMPGGRVANTAAILADDDRFNVIMASEVSADPVGDILMRHLERSGVVTSSVDRFTEGRTALNVFQAPDAASAPTAVTRYEDYPEEAFDIVWPRVDEGDIVLFGGYYSIDRRMRQRMLKFLANCAERKAVLIYLPGFMPQQEPRITRVMPAILENLEMAHITVARSSDLELIFGVGDSSECYRRHIDFYCRSLITIDPEARLMSYYAGSEHTDIPVSADLCRTMMWNAGAVAGIVAETAAAGLTQEELDAPAEPVRRRILEAAVRSAASAAETITRHWQEI